MRIENTPAVERAVQVGQHWAARQSEPEVAPLHLLAGLLAEEEGRVAELLVQGGLDLAAWRRAHGEPPSSEEPPPPVPLSPETAFLLSEARSLAHELFAETSLSSDCVLLALLRQDATVRHSLEDAGVDVTAVETTLLGLAPPPLEMDEPLHLEEPTVQVDAARVLDANLNRAREALRVLEDYCRFCLDDRFLCRQLKEMRHGMLRQLYALPEQLLLHARDTLADVGTTITTPTEQVRHSLQEVVQANCKRLQEALRSLEEFSKLFGAQLGREWERLRYQSYTLERALVWGGAARQRLAECTLQVLLTGAQCTHSLERTVREAAAGGAHIIQMREKELNDRLLLQRARDMRRWTRAEGVLFVVNDRPDVARLVEADGIHLGQEDLPIKEVRRLVGTDMLIGVSTHNLLQLRQAILDGASYVGVGPTFPSPTKSFEEFAGLEYAQQAAAETTLPAFAIGGINPKTLSTALAVGVRRIAVSHAIAQAESPRAAALALRQLLDSVRA